MGSIEVFKFRSPEQNGRATTKQYGLGSIVLQILVNIDLLCPRVSTRVNAVHFASEFFY